MSNYGTDRNNGGVYRVEDILADVYDSESGRLLVSLSKDPKYSNYESKQIYPGTLADGFNVKSSGGMFTEVTIAYRTILKNNSDNAPITIYLNTDNVKPIEIKANGEFDLGGFKITNIFIDTGADFDSDSVEITIFG